MSSLSQDDIRLHQLSRIKRCENSHWIFFPPTQAHYSLMIKTERTTENIYIIDFLLKHLFLTMCLKSAPIKNPSHNIKGRKDNKDDRKWQGQHKRPITNRDRHGQDKTNVSICHQPYGKAFKCLVKIIFPFTLIIVIKNMKINNVKWKRNSWDIKV